MSSQTLQTGASNLPCVHLCHPCGDRAEIYTHGAHVTSWQTAQQGEQLYLSRESFFAPGKAIRGGVPVIFPQFGAFGPGAKHGFARTMNWQWDEAASSACCAEFVLESSAETRNAWPFDFVARYRVELTPGALLMQLQVRNTSAQAMAFTNALHTYLASPDYRAGVLSGVAGLEFWDNGSPWEQRQQQVGDELTINDALDRVYFNAVSPLVWKDAARSLVIQAEGFSDVVVWNPGTAGAQGLSDMADDDFPNMVCVEAANVAQPTQLAPGALWCGSQRIVVQES
jgi:glucose-6-phosphate 1-epimerase